MSGNWILVVFLLYWVFQFPFDMGLTFYNKGDEQAYDVWVIIWLILILIGYISYKIKKVDEENREAKEKEAEKLAKETADHLKQDKPSPRKSKDKPKAEKPDAIIMPYTERNNTVSEKTKTTVNIKRTKIHYKEGEQELNVSVEDRDIDIIRRESGNIVQDLPEEILEHTRGNEAFDTAPVVEAEEVRRIEASDTRKIGTPECGYVTVNGVWERKYDDNHPHQNTWINGEKLVCMEAFPADAIKQGVDGLIAVCRKTLKEMSQAEIWETDSSFGRYSARRLIKYSGAENKYTGGVGAIIAWCFAAGDGTLHYITLISPMSEIVSIEYRISHSYEYYGEV